MCEYAAGADDWYEPIIAANADDWYAPTVAASADDWYIPTVAASADDSSSYDPDWTDGAEDWSQPVRANFDAPVTKIMPGMVSGMEPPSDPPPPSDVQHQDSTSFSSSPHIQSQFDPLELIDCSPKGDLYSRDIPSNLSQYEHIRAAEEQFSRPPLSSKIDPEILECIEERSKLGSVEEIARFRDEMLHTFQGLVDSTKCEYEEWKASLPPNASDTIGAINGPLIRHLTEALQLEDYSLFEHLAGFPLVGEMPVSGRGVAESKVAPLLESEVTGPLKEKFQNFVKNNKPPRDKKLMKELWSQTTQDVRKGQVEGPFTSDSCPFRRGLQSYHCTIYPIGLSHTKEKH